MLPFAWLSSLSTASPSSLLLQLLHFFTDIKTQLMTCSMGPQGSSGPSCQGGTTMAFSFVDPESHQVLGFSG